MEIREFVNQIEQSKDLIPLSMIVKEEVNGDTRKAAGVSHVIVKHEPTNLEVKLPINAIQQADWETLHNIITGKREPSVLQHMTRVVGYYSKIENWNSSKIGELEDRHKGDYEVKDK